MTEYELVDLFKSLVQGMLVAFVSTISLFLVAIYLAASKDSPLFKLANNKTWRVGRDGSAILVRGSLIGLRLRKFMRRCHPTRRLT